MTVTFLNVKLLNFSSRLIEIASKMARTMNLYSKKFLEAESFITGFHVYKKFWEPVQGESLTVENEPCNVEDHFAVAVKRDDEIIGHLPRDDRHLIFFFLQEDVIGKCIAIVTGKPVNLGDKLGQKVPCRLRVSGRKEYVNALERLL